MFIPRYWAEAGHLERLPGRRQATLRRFGWSSVSEEDARVHARRRLEEALAAFRAGGAEALRDFTRCERKVAYSGSDGLPIREEIVEEYPALEVVVTRNGYGALCLNTPRAMFVDVDRPDFAAGCWGCTGAVVGALLGAVAGRWVLGSTLSGIFLGALASGLAAYVAGKVRLLLSLHLRDVLEWARKRVHDWCGSRPRWLVAVYETPAGARLLVLHSEFDAGEEEAREFMQHVGVDPLYRRMCELQKCFRARVSAKPWRAGIADHFRAGGVWPVTAPEKLARRREWISRYDAARTGYAACRFVEEVGGGVRDRRVEDVRRLHDELSAAGRDLPLA